MISGELERLRERLVEMVGDTESDTPKARRRRLILDAATRLFVAQGYRKTSMEEVAASCGMAKGTLYLYFKNKSELLVACSVREKLGQFSRFEFLADPEVHARTKLVRFVELALLATRDMPLNGRLLQRKNEMAAVLASMPAELLEESMRDRYTLLVPLLNEATATTLPEPELRARADVLIGAGFLAGELSFDHVRGGLSQEDFARRFAEAVVKGVL